MMSMSWSDDNAAKADNVVKQCPVGSRPNSGINLSWGWPQLTASGAMQKCYDQKSIYQVEADICSAGISCSDYRQMVWGENTKVGCASNICPNILGQPQVEVWACVYSQPSQQNVRPFTIGAACSMCAQGTKCESGLCTSIGQQSMSSSQQSLSSSSNPTTMAGLSGLGNSTNAKGKMTTNNVSLHKKFARTEISFQMSSRTRVTRWSLMHQQLQPTGMRLPLFLQNRRDRSVQISTVRNALLILLLDGHHAFDSTT